VLFYCFLAFFFSLSLFFFFFLVALGKKRTFEGDPVQHIELRHWAQIFVIAPLSANTLAKLANGLCDNLVSTFFLCEISDRMKE